MSSRPCPPQLRLPPLHVIVAPTHHVPSPLGPAPQIDGPSLRPEFAAAAPRCIRHDTCPAPPAPPLPRFPCPTSNLALSRPRSRPQHVHCRRYVTPFLWSPAPELRVAQLPRFPSPSLPLAYFLHLVRRSPFSPVDAGPLSILLEHKHDSEHANQFDGRCRRRATLFKPMPLSTPNSCFVVHPQLVGPSAAPPIRMPRPRESLTSRSEQNRQGPARTVPLATPPLPAAVPPRALCTRFSADLVLAARASRFYATGLFGSRRAPTFSAASPSSPPDRPSPHRRTRTGLLGLAALVPAAVRDDAVSP
ncbi:hypothetical protein DFH09DRAFT_1382625 [Mycena vulgaris]|nr:hypothetical protein DFH09DRAFT_1382625 [Mycena vulgaris]